ncbi:radical SAM protein [Clostridium celatum]|uniref:Radical SAM domain protein n=1 Tax=Clostridium celatum DSM 1785 TaxID=545697 RepID=L1QPB8_9CLOT|nr:radical SAM protein [Clostridium celatum]EKY29818.1 radical SAM domain protein [Clostridium celatum DSM 1785]MCE9656392.1 radical SAM protein [Clostridium celatum]
MAVEPRISKYLFAKASKSKIPLSGTFELSPCCNLDCRMCYVRKTKQEVNELGGEKTVEEWLELARECRDAGMLFLLLTGGEPFLYKDFKRLYLELKKMGFMISINTNGTLIDEEVVSWLSKNPPYRMQITLYGGSNETYERLCRDNKGFDKTTKAIKMLKEAGIAIKINASMTQYNIEDLDKIYEFAKENNVYVQATSYMFPPTRRNEEAIGIGDRFTPQEAAHYSVKIDQLRLEKDEFSKRAIAMREGLIKFKSELEECESLDSSAEDSDNIENKNIIDNEETREKLKCRAGKSSFWINWKGEMTACGMMNWPVAYPFKEGLIPAWYKIIDETDKLRMPKKCTKCEKKFACTVCGASVVTETGDFEKAPKYICKMTEKILEETEKAYKLIAPGAK